jgi:hypothetical protein
MQQAANKGWLTSLIGIVYAMLILFLQQLSAGSIDYITIIEAGAAILFGLKASDNLKAQGAFELLVVQWKTTLIGVLTGAGALLFTYYQAAQPITLLVVFKALGVTLLGMISKDTQSK